MGVRLSSEAILAGWLHWSLNQNFSFKKGYKLWWINWLNYYSIRVLITARMKCLRNSMLKIKDIYEANVLKFVYKCINEPSTPICRTYFQKRNEFHDRDLRYTDRLHIPAATTALAQSATRNTGVSLWNKLPEEIKSQTDINLFSKKIKGHIIQKYWLFPWFPWIEVCHCPITRRRVFWYHWLVARLLWPWLH